jgi:hypothetical protein
MSSSRLGTDCSPFLAPHTSAGEACWPDQDPAGFPDDRARSAAGPPR